MELSETKVLVVWGWVNFAYKTRRFSGGEEVV